MKSRLTSLLLVFALLVTVFPLNIQADDSLIKIMIDDVELETDVAPVIINDRTMLPVRTIAESIGGEVEWDAENAIATITKDDTVIKLTINSLVAIVNDADVILDVSAQIIDDRTMVPVRFISENLGLDVDFLDRVVYIKTISSENAELPEEVIEDEIEVEIEETVVSLDENDIYNSIIALKSEYPQGMSWTNDNYYYVSKIRLSAYGCVAFAYTVSDIVFGDLPITQLDDFSNIRVGDIIRMNNGNHTVLVLSVDGETITVAEGNYNNAINWGRQITMSQIISTGVSLTTRYPQ